mgnify:CR=1 FL=1
MEEYKGWAGKILGIILLLYICGECCTLFSDGKLDQVDVQVAVKTHLRETLYDWDSYKSLSWSDFKEYSDGGYSIVHYILFHCRYCRVFSSNTFDIPSTTF